MMTTVAAPATTAMQAQAVTNEYLLTNIGDRLVADEPALDTIVGVWRVPVLLSYAVLGPLGRVGEFLVSVANGQLVSHTPLEELKSAARALYERHRDAIEAPLP